MPGAPAGGAPPWFAGGLRFACVPGCVACCTGEPGDVWVTPEETAALAAALSVPLPAFERECTRRARGGRVSLRERADGDCVLLTARGCAAYEARPAQCRAFPFWEEILSSPGAWRSAARGCPGIGQGRLWTIEEIERARR